ncbi:MAG: hypothetical protein ACTSRW_06000 [Candidatus Helarchaeota archaeon]
MPDRRWNLKNAEVEVSGDTIIVDSKINYKDFEADYKGFISNLSDESQEHIKKLFKKKKVREQTPSDESMSELIDFFDMIQRHEAAADAITSATETSEVARSQDTDLSDDLTNKFDIRIGEIIDLKFKHDNELSEAAVTGRLSIKNNGNKHRIWDIDVELENLEKTNLDDEKIHVLDLEPEEEHLVEYEVKTDEIDSPLTITEEINVNPEGEKPTQVYVADAEQKPIMSIKIKNTGLSPLNNIKITKEIPESYDSYEIERKGLGTVEQDPDKLTWTIDSLESEEETELEIQLRITPRDNEPISSGSISASYEMPGSSFSDMKVKYVDGYTINIYYVESSERDEEPNVWDCKFIFENRSEFPIKLVDVDLRAGDYNTEEQVVDLGPQLDPDVILKPSEEWTSETWEISSEDVPKFGSNVQFTIIGDVICQSVATVHIEPISMPVLTLTGTKEFSETVVESYKETPIDAITKVQTSGSASIDKFHIEDTIPHTFVVEEPEEKVVLTVNGKEIPAEKMRISWEPEDDIERDRKMIIDVDDVLEEVGVLEDDSKIELTYLMKVVNPKQDEEFTAPITFQAITDDGSIIELQIPAEGEVEPTITLKVVHLRRRTRDARFIQAGDSKGVYNISIIHKNRGDAAEENKVFEEMLPENFELVSADPEPEQEENKLTWTFEKIEPDEEITIEYTVKGTGEYKARETQISYKI